MYAPVDRYVHSMMEISSDYTIWKSIVDTAILQYQKQGVKDVKNELCSMLFSAYNLNAKTGKDFLYIYPRNIPLQQDSFFRWVANLAILRVYNSIEILLYSVIMEEYMRKKYSLANAKEDELVIKFEIRKYLKKNKVEQLEERYIIQYLYRKSPEVNDFVREKMRVDLDTTWLNFFEFISMLRNLVAHNAMVVNPSNMTQIEKIAGDVYYRYFSNEILLEGNEEQIILNPKSDYFDTFLGFMNDFALNMVKCIKKQQDFAFLSLVG